MPFSIPPPASSNLVALTHAVIRARGRLPGFWSFGRQIPNQTLLHFFRAHALKYGIAMRGGVKDCAEWLGVQAIPGKWSLALLEDEVAQLQQEGKLGGDEVERAFYFIPLFGWKRLGALNFV